MVLRRPKSKDIEWDRNFNIRGSSILENFAGFNFRESSISKILPELIFANLHSLGSKKESDFLPAKISSLKVSTQGPLG